jgi:hypothetical protein
VGASLHRRNLRVSAFTVERRDIEGLIVIERREKTLRQMIKRIIKMLRFTL